jgi:membrane-associated phospholipid phosphatase
MSGLSAAPTASATEAMAEPHVAQQAPVSQPPVTQPAPAPNATPTVAPHAQDSTPKRLPPEANDAATYHFQPGVVCPFCQLTPQFPEGRSGLHWHSHWSSVGPREYLTIGALAAGIVSFRLLTTEPTHADWSSPILFDNGVRNALRIDSASGRKTAAQVSDILFAWEILHPTVIDPLIVAWWQRQSPYVAWQMFVIDAQAYSLTLMINDVVKHVTARARPWVETDDCAANPGGEECGSGGRYLSFYSGHAAVTATGAGLLCAHHTQLSLYQNPVLDTGTCALAVLGTAVTGAMRIASDNHWASDVVVGHLAGYLSGYLLPTLLYYKQFRITPHDDHPSEPAAPTFAVLPLLGPDSAQVSIVGLL